MEDTLNITAVVALLVNLVALLHYGTRMKRDGIDQMKAEEKRWGDHETRLVLLERNSRNSFDARAEEMELRMNHGNDTLLRLLAEMVDYRTGPGPHSKRII